MTKQRIEKYTKLQKEISALEERIYNLELHGGEYVSDVVKDGSSGHPKPLVIKGYGSSRIPRLQARLSAKTAECNAIEEFIDSVDDSVIWQLLTFRYIEGHTLEETADLVGYSRNHAGRLLSEFFKKMITHDDLWC